MDPSFSKVPQRRCSPLTKKNVKFTIDDNGKDSLNKEGDFNAYKSDFNYLEDYIVKKEKEKGLGSMAIRSLEKEL